MESVSARGIAYQRRGAGEPLLLIHGTGGSRFHWQPVVEKLAAERELLLVDLPGHAASLPPPADVSHTPIGYAELLGELLDELGIRTAHAAGNSAGGWTALELAKRGRARSVVAIAPAGLWRRRDPLRCTLKLAGQYRMGRLFAPLTARAFRNDAGRTALMRDSVARPRELAPEAAIELARIYRETPGFRNHLAATRRARFEGGHAIDVPVTIAWGDKERLIPPKARLRDELPAQTKFATLPDCGHLAMWDDPDLVAATILDGTALGGPTPRPAIQG